MAASSAAAITESIGISSWEMMTPAVAIDFFARTTSALESVSLADWATAMRFSRDFPPMKINAMPLPTFGRLMKWRTSMPSAFSAALAERPKSSSP
jgi:hypothetical protein